MTQSTLPTPHYHGHRERLRHRFLTGDAEKVADYELLELLLFSANPRGDVKPLAKTLLQSFGSLAKALAATPESLRSIKGIGDTAIATLKAVQEAANRMLRPEVLDDVILNQFDKVKAYCHGRMAHLEKEQFRILYLDRKNRLLADEVQQEGTIDHIAIYPREVMKRALALSASAIILVHNHPSGDPTPSQADKEVTNQIHQAAKSLNVVLHDHIIVARSGSYSFRERGLITQG